MRYFVLFTVLLLAACSQTPPPQSVMSAGCQNINDAFYDSAYLSGNVYFSPFKKGESVTVSLEPAAKDRATQIWLIVSDASVSPSQDLVTWRAESSEPLRYTFPQDMSQAEVYWSADAGVPEWAIGCE